MSIKVRLKRSRM